MQISKLSRHDRGFTDVAPSKSALLRIFFSHFHRQFPVLGPSEAQNFFEFGPTLRCN
jgi:hypothetical protein